MKKKDVLYCGDATIDGGASYLAGIMTHFGISYDYVAMEQPMPRNRPSPDYKLIILSDYPVCNMTPKQAARIVELVKEGTSLLMIGGWESFHGLIGGYQDSPIAGVLPVECLSKDDRNNECQGLVPVVLTNHPTVDGLPWDEPPIVCGFNTVVPKPGSLPVLGLRRLSIRKGKVALGKTAEPLLVIGKFGKGKTGAFTTDFAPHWVGGLVDWGLPRINAMAPGGKGIEVGKTYADFIEKLLRFFL
jgi:hypothetical protein